MNECKHCVYNKMLNVCNTCNINPLFNNQFRTTDAFYPLEIEGTHINLWNMDGKTKFSIAIFKYSALEDDWGIELISARVINPRVDWLKLKELITIGYNNLENTKG